MLKKNIVTLLLMILVAWGGYSQAELSASSSNDRGSQLKPVFTYKDPFLAGVLSWVMPGAGQIYAQSYTKGSVFIFANLVDKSSMVLLLLYLNNNYKNVSTGISWKDLDTRDKALIISYFAISTTLKLYNSIDAIYTAEKYNKTRSMMRVGFYVDPITDKLVQSPVGFQLTWQERL